jgi:hypothetical protein
MSSPKFLGFANDRINLAAVASALPTRPGAADCSSYFMTTVTPAPSLVHLSLSEHDFIIDSLYLVHSRLQSLLSLRSQLNWYPVPLNPQSNLGKQLWFRQVSQPTRPHAPVASVTQVRAHVLVLLA